MALGGVVLFLGGVLLSLGGVLLSLGIVLLTLLLSLSLGGVVLSLGGVLLSLGGVLLSLGGVLLSLSIVLLTLLLFLFWWRWMRPRTSRRRSWRPCCRSLASATAASLALMTLSIMAKYSSSSSLVFFTSAPFPLSGSWAKIHPRNVGVAL